MGERRGVSEWGLNRGKRERSGRGRRREREMEMVVHFMPCHLLVQPGASFSLQHYKKCGM